MFKFIKKDHLWIICVSWSSGDYRISVDTPNNIRYMETILGFYHEEAFENWQAENP